MKTINEVLSQVDRIEKNLIDLGRAFEKFKDNYFGTSPMPLPPSYRSLPAGYGTPQNPPKHKPYKKRVKEDILPLDIDKAPKLFRVDTCSRILECSISHIYRMTQYNYIPCYKKGRRVIFKKEDIREFIASGKYASFNSREVIQEKLNIEKDQHNLEIIHGEVEILKNQL